MKTRFADSQKKTQKTEMSETPPSKIVFCNIHIVKTLKVMCKNRARRRVVFSDGPYVIFNSFSLRILQNS